MKNDYPLTPKRNLYSFINFRPGAAKRSRQIFVITRRGDGRAGKGAGRGGVRWDERGGGVSPLFRAQSGSTTAMGVDDRSAMMRLGIAARVTQGRAP